IHQWRTNYERRPGTHHEPLFSQRYREILARVDREMGRPMQANFLQTIREWAFRSTYNPDGNPPNDAFPARSDEFPPDPRWRERMYRFLRAVADETGEDLVRTAVLRSFGEGRGWPYIGPLDYRTRVAFLGNYPSPGLPYDINRFYRERLWMQGI